MKLIQNQFFGRDKDKYPKSTPGSLYIATDTRKIYIYDRNSDPRVINATITGGGGSEIIVDNYAALPVGEPEDTIAFVLNSTGTAWLPGTLGGTYYPAGWYIMKAGVWRHSRELVDQEIEELNDAITSLSNSLTTHTGRTDNPHVVTKAQVGLSNVDNTSDLAKPISTATQNALNNKSNVGHTHTKSEITDFNETDYASGAEGDLAATAVQPGDNVSDLLNDVSYTVVGSDISQFVNDEVYLQPSDNVSALTNDAGYIAGQEITSFRSEATGVVLYSGWLLGTTPIIKKCDNSIETFATGVTDLETDWTNRLSLTYV